MNNNFTHRELKNFELRFLNFFSIQTSLPAGHRFAVNYLLVECNNLLNLPAIFMFFNGNKPVLKLTPIVTDNLCNFKNVNQHSL